MTKRTDKAAGRKPRRARRGPTVGKGKHTRPRPAQPARGSGGPVDVTALTVRELADLLGIPCATMCQHVKAGAPCTGGRPPACLRQVGRRRLPLIEYAAWLNSHTASRRGDREPRYGHVAKRPVDIRRLRPTQLLRLLNSTALGPVMTRSQLPR